MDSRLQEIHDWVQRELWEIRLMPLLDQEQFVQFNDVYDPVTVPDILFCDEESGSYEMN